MGSNKGFSLVELLGAIVIMGILMAISLGAFGRYKQHAINQSYMTMSEGAADAAENYFMDYTNATSVSIADLVDLQYLENAKDPASKERNCTGTVSKYDLKKGDGKKIDVLSLKVSINCTNHKSCYIYPGKTKC